VFLAAPGAEGFVALLNLLGPLGPIRGTKYRDGGDRNPLTELTVLLTEEWTIILTDLTR
jgi:hypothetical protein